MCINSLECKRFDLYGQNQLYELLHILSLFTPLILPPTNQIIDLGSLLVGAPNPLALPQASEAGNLSRSLLKVSGSVVGFKHPTRARKHTGGTKKS